MATRCPCITRFDIVGQTMEYSSGLTVPETAGPVPAPQEPPGCAEMPGGLVICD